MKMSAINKKISWSLLAAFLGTAIGALSGQFVWTFFSAVGAWVLVAVAQNLCDFHWATDREVLANAPNAEDTMINRPDDRNNWGRQRNDEVIFDPSFEGTPGNIWSRSVSTNHD